MSILAKPRLRVPPHTRLRPSNSRTLASLTVSNTAANSPQLSSRPINPLTIQHQHPQACGGGVCSPLTPPLAAATPIHTPDATSHLSTAAASYFSFPTPTSIPPAAGAAQSSTTSSSYFFSPSPQQGPAPAPARQPIRRRALHTSTRRRAQKGAERRDEISTEPTEYSKTGTDDQAAAQHEAAFEPGRTRPEDQLEKAGEGQGSRRNNPLDVSPANQDVSRPHQNADVGSAKGGKENGKPSGGGSPSKAGKISR